MIDGEKVRRGLTRDLGYTAEDRSENLRRSGHLAQILNEAGLICLASFVAPSEDVRQKVGKLIGQERFLVVHVATPLETCRERDTKGQYKLADEGELPNFPGVTAKYDAPENPDLVLDASEQSIDACADAVIELLRNREIIK